MAERFGLAAIRALRWWSAPTDELQTTHGGRRAGQEASYKLSLSARPSAGGDSGEAFGHQTILVRLTSTSVGVEGPQFSGRCEGAEQSRGHHARAQTGDAQAPSSPTAATRSALRAGA